MGKEASKGKNSPFFVYTDLETGYETDFEEESKVDSESRTEETTLAQNAKDVPVSEEVKNPSKLQNLVIYGKSSIESGANAGISVKIICLAKVMMIFQ